MRPIRTSTTEVRSRSADVSFTEFVTVMYHTSQCLVRRGVCVCVCVCVHRLVTCVSDQCLRSGIIT